MLFTVEFVTAANSVAFVFVWSATSLRLSVLVLLLLVSASVMVVVVIVVLVVLDWYMDMSLMVFRSRFITEFCPTTHDGSHPPVESANEDDPDPFFPRLALSADVSFVTVMRISSHCFENHIRKGTVSPSRVQIQKKGRLVSRVDKPFLDRTARTKGRKPSTGR